MATTPRILGFAGSLRAGSFNKKLVQIALGGARAAGAETTYLDLRDVPMPIFDEDDEAANGLPPGARKLRELLQSHHAFIISSPEYNSSISAVLKNGIDWATRPVPGEKPLACFNGKLTSLLSTSPGALGGLRGLVHLRAILGNIGVIVLPDQFAVGMGHEAIGADGRLVDAKQQAAVEAIGATLATTTAKLIA